MKFNRNNIVRDPRDLWDEFDDMFHECKKIINSHDDYAGYLIDFMDHLDSNEELDNKKFKEILVNLCEYFGIEREIKDPHVFKIHQHAVGQ